MKTYNHAQMTSKYLFEFESLPHIVFTTLMFCIYSFIIIYIIFHSKGTVGDVDR